MSSRITMKDKDKLAKLIYGYECYSDSTKFNKEYIDSIATYGELSGNHAGRLFLFRKPDIFVGEVQYMELPKDCPPNLDYTFRKNVTDNMRGSDILFVTYQLMETEEWKILKRVDDKEYILTLSSPHASGSVFIPKIVHKDYVKYSSGLLVDNPVDRDNILAAAFDSLEKYEKRLYTYVKKYRSAS